MVYFIAIPQSEQVEVGIGSYTSGDLLLRAHHPGNRIRIGKFCSFGQKVTVFAGGNHPLSMLTTHPLRLMLEQCSFAEWGNACGDALEVTVIGNDVWIGHGAMILSGSTIHDGAVIGAGAIVRGDVPPYSIAIGNPARVVRKRFGDETIERLLKIRWWDWPIDEIRTISEQICSSDIDQLEAMASKLGLPR